MSTETRTFLACTCDPGRLDTDESEEIRAVGPHQAARLYARDYLDESESPQLVFVREWAASHIDQIDVVVKHVSYTKVEIVGQRARAGDHGVMAASG